MTSVGTFQIIIWNKNESHLVFGEENEKKCTFG